MPELPEVETVRRGLAHALVGAVIDKVEARRPDLRFPLPKNFVQRLSGARIDDLDRRGKYLLWHLDRGETLIAHLGMSGRFLLTMPGSTSPPQDLAAFAQSIGPEEKHDHVVFTLSTGAVATYRDPRRFGFMHLQPTASLFDSPLLAGMGPEPWSNVVHGDWLCDLAQGRAAPLKNFLLDQRIIAGLGNIYVCEALFAARLHPFRAAGTLDRAAAADLIQAIRAVLEAAIAAGGSSLRDFAAAHGELGYFQHRFQVYDREGQTCARRDCAGIVERAVQAGRSSFFCPQCQS